MFVVDAHLSNFDSIQETGSKLGVGSLLRDYGTLVHNNSFLLGYLMVDIIVASWARHMEKVCLSMS